MAASGLEQTIDRMRHVAVVAGAAAAFGLVVRVSPNAGRARVLAVALQAALASSHSGSKLVVGPVAQRPVVVRMHLVTGQARQGAPGVATRSQQRVVFSAHDADHSVGPEALPEVRAALVLLGRRAQGDVIPHQVVPRSEWCSRTQELLPELAAPQLDEPVALSAELGRALVRQVGRIDHAGLAARCEVLAITRQRLAIPAGMFACRAMARLAGDAELAHLGIDRSPVAEARAAMGCVAANAGSVPTAGTYASKFHRGRQQHRAARDPSLFPDEPRQRQLLDLAPVRRGEPIDLVVV